MQHSQQLGALSDVQHEEAPYLQHPASTQQAGIVFPWQHSFLFSVWQACLWASVSQHSDVFPPWQQLFAWEDILFLSNFFINYRFWTCFPFKCWNKQFKIVLNALFVSSSMISNRFGSWSCIIMIFIHFLVQFFCFEMIKIDQNRPFVNDQLIRINKTKSINVLYKISIFFYSFFLILFLLSNFQTIVKTNAVKKGKGSAYFEA